MMSPTCINQRGTAFLLRWTPDWPIQAGDSVLSNGGHLATIKRVRTLANGTHQAVAVVENYLSDIEIASSTEITRGAPLAID